MPHFYVHAQGDSYLDLLDLNKIADKSSAALMAVDTLDADDIAVNRAQLSPKSADEKRDYLFYIEAEDRATAEDVVNGILATAQAERDRAVYNDLQHLLREYPQASWRDDIQATLLYGQDAVDLLIFAPGQAVNGSAKIYYRGRAENGCLELLKLFTKFDVKL